VEGVFLGPSTTTRDSDFLQAQKISHIILARSEREKSFLKPRDSPAEIQYHVIDIDDSPITSCMASFLQFLDLIDSLTKQDNRVLVVGMTGMNRSAALVAVYVMHRFLFPVDTAIEYMISRRRCVSISQNVKRQMEEFATAKIAFLSQAVKPDTDSSNRKRRSELVQS